MKYIRTKDKIYENILGDVLPNLKRIECQDIIAKADTIEELSDYFFHLTYNSDTDNYEINYWSKANKLNEYLKDYKEELKFGIGIGEDKLFLAILTDKGLVFVAKMNEKGNLELLWN